MIFLDGFWWPNGTEDYRQRYLRHRRDGQALIDLLRRCRTCVQAGGHVGTWPTWLAEHFVRVHTFEPDPENLACLQRNVLGLDNVTFHPAALAARPGRVGWSHSERNSGGHYVVPGGGDVTATTIDALELAGCDAIFLDVEGSELEALRGAEATIERCAPALQLEWNEKGEKVGLSTRAALGGWLAEHGYRLVAEVAKDRVYIR